MNNALSIQRNRRLFIQFVTACVVLSYPAFILWGRPEMLLTPLKFVYWLGAGYVHLWFLKPAGFAAWFAAHSLYALSCWWWFRRGSLQSWLATLLFGMGVSALGGMAVNLAIRFPRQLGLF